MYISPYNVQKRITKIYNSIKIITIEIQKACCKSFYQMFAHSTHLSMPPMTLKILNTLRTRRKSNVGSVKSSEIVNGAHYKS